MAKVRGDLILEVDASNNISAAYAYGPGKTSPVNIGSSASHRFLPRGWNDVWEAAKAASGSALARMTVTGHSIPYGQGSTDFNNKGWAGKLRTAVAESLGVGGDYYSTIRSESLSQTFGSVAYGGTPPWVVNGSSPGTASSLAFGHMLWWSGSAPAPALTFTSPYAATSLDIVYYDRGAGTPGWSYSIDGATAVNVNTTGSGTMKKVSVTGLSNIAHSVVINALTNNACAIDGIAIYASTTSGLYAALYGKQAATITSIGGTAVSVPQNYAGWNGTTYGNQIGLSSPHLLIMELLVNECNTGNVGPAEFKHRVRPYIEYLRRGRSNISILFVVSSYANSVTMDSTTGWTNYQSYQHYVDSIYQLANQFCCGVVNMHSRWGSNTVAGGYRTTGDPHPNDTGHADYATAIGEVL